MNVSLPDVHTLTDVGVLIGQSILGGLEQVIRNPYGLAVALVLLVILTATVIGDRSAAWRFTDYDDDTPFLTEAEREAAR